ncbi:hypothetical protein ABPG72_017896 [Tetrahymena utriculariae]
MQENNEKSNETTQFFECEKQKSNQNSPKIIYRRRFSSNNAQLSDFIEICNKEGDKIFNDMNLNEGYIKFKNGQVSNRIYAKSVTKRRTPISFKVRGSSCQKQREDDQHNLQLIQNQIYMKEEKDNYLQAEIKNQIGLKEEHCNKQTNGAFKKLAVSPIQIEQQEAQKNFKTNFSNRFLEHSPNRAIANSFVLKIKHNPIKEQPYLNLETSFKSNTETLRQNRAKNKVIDSSFLTGKREGNLGYNSTSITTSFSNANGRIKNSATPVIDVSEVNVIDQKAIQSINPKTLPFLSSDRGINQNNHFHFGEFKICTSKAVEMFQNNILSKTQKQQQSSNQISQSVTSTITYSSQGNNQANTNKQNNLNRTKNNTISMNPNIIQKHHRYSSNTPSKRIKGIIISSVLSENQSNKETLQASNRNSQIRKRPQIVQKQNTILANSIQHIYSNIEENAGQLSKNRKINNTTNLDSTNFQTNEISEKTKHNQGSNTIQQAINKQQFNKILVNFSKLRREGQNLGKGFLGSILTSIPKHPIYTQFIQRQKNSLNVESRIINKVKDLNQNQPCNEHGLQQPKNSNQAIEIVKQLVQKINSQLNNLQINLSIMKSSNKILLDAIEQNQSTEILYQIEKYTDTSQSSKQISKIQINELIPLMKQCFDSTYDLSDPSTMAFLQTDNEDSEQEDKNSARERKKEIK